MTTNPDLRELLAPMVDREVSLDAAEFRVDRGRVLARMADAAESKRRSHVRYAFPLLAAAAVLVLVLAGSRWNRNGSAVSLDVLVTEGQATQTQGQSRSLVAHNETVQIAAAGELETAAASRAKVSMEDGLQIELRDRTRVGLGALRRGTSQLKLVGGAVRCIVPHRTADHAFHVVTADVTVYDLGTIFTVSIDDATHVTRVSVEEGEVMIRTSSGETRLVAPNSWSNAVAPEAEPPASAEPAPSAVIGEPPRQAASRTASSTAAKAAVRTSLAHEAQLLRQGLTSERQGRPAEAVAALRQLLSENPSSPLAPDARAALARVEAQPH